MAAPPGPWALLAGVAAAGALFTPLFAGGGLLGLDFWWGMAAVNALLLGLAALLERGLLRRLAGELGRRPAASLALGLLSAIILYGVFWSGGHLARLLLPGAGEGIARVYALKEGASPLRVALLMGLVFGPGEELFWRGFLQRHLALRLGPVRGWLAATALYAGVHLGTGNPMLLLAALVCGLFWGGLYLRRELLLLNVVSHTAWDLAVFLAAPL